MRVKPDWDLLAENVHPSVFVADVNCQRHESLCGDYHPGGTFPTIMIFRKDGPPTLYQGGLGYEDLMRFVDKELAEPCRLEQMSTTCNEKEQKYIVKWGAKERKAARTEISRLEAIDGSSLTLELSRWRDVRLRILEQIVVSPVGPRVDL